MLPPGSAWHHTRQSGYEGHSLGRGARPTHLLAQRSVAWPGQLAGSAVARVALGRTPQSRVSSLYHMPGDNLRSQLLHRPVVPSYPSGSSGTWAVDPAGVVLNLSYRLSGALSATNPEAFPALSRLWRGTGIRCHQKLDERAT